MLTKEALAEIERRHKAATPGPWYADKTGSNIFGPLGLDGSRDLICCGIATGPSDDENDEFIAHARTDIPDLLADLRELVARIAKMDARVADSEADCFKLGEEIAALRRDAEETRRLAEAMAQPHINDRHGDPLYECNHCLRRWYLQESHANNCPVAAYRAHVAGEG